jgi:hypothetical protein
MLTAFDAAAVAFMVILSPGRPRDAGVAFGSRSTASPPSC